MKTVFSMVKSSLRYAFIGAFTCMLATLFAEIFVRALDPMVNPAGSQESLVISLLVDTSGSMEGEPIAEVIVASKHFLSSVDRSNTHIALIPFSDYAYRLSPILQPAQDPAVLISQVERFRAEGGTNMSDALMEAGNTFTEFPSAAYAVILFTDGEPDYRIQALLQAESLRRMGTILAAVGTEGADHAFLHILVGENPDLVFTTQLGDYANAFDLATQAVVSSAFGTATTSQGLLIVTIVAFFLATALLVAENVWGLRGAWWRDIWWIPPLGLLLGLLGGVVGENLIQLDIVSWALVGFACGVAVGLTDLIQAGRLRIRLPARARRGALWGLAGGIIGGVLFRQILGNASLDTAQGEWVSLLSRVIGFGLLGFSVGLALKAGEELLKNVWLMGVSTGPYEGKQYILGKSLVSIGHSGKNDINLIRETALESTAGHFLQQQEHWFFQPLGNPGHAGTVSINGEEVHDKIQLTDNTVIRFGNTDFVFRRPSDPGATVKDFKWALAGDEATYPLPALNRIRIGSDTVCDIVLPHQSVQRHHCTLRFTNQGIELAATAGSDVSVNDEQLPPRSSRVLRQGDLIALGHVELGLVQEGQDA